MLPSLLLPTKIKAMPTRRVFKKRSAGYPGIRARKRNGNMSPVELQRTRKANRAAAKRHRDRVRGEAARKACRLTELNITNAELKQMLQEHLVQLQSLKYAVQWAVDLA